MENDVQYLGKVRMYYTVNVMYLFRSCNVSARSANLVDPSIPYGGHNAAFELPSSSQPSAQTSAWLPTWAA